MKGNFEKWRWPETVSFRTTTGEAQRISQQASQMNLTRSEFLRGKIEKLLNDDNREEKENR